MVKTRCFIYILVLAMFFLSACQSTPSQQPGVIPAPQTPAAPVLKSVFGAVVTIDLKARQLVVFDTISKKNLTLVVNDATEVIQYNRKGNLSDVTVGSPADVTYDETTMTAIKIIGGEPPPPQLPR